MSFRDILLADFTNTFANPNEWAEAVTYVKGAVERPIYAIVDRQLPEAALPNQESLRPVIRVSVANDSTSGISAGELDTGSDTIEMSLYEGGTAVALRINKIVSCDSAMIMLEVG